MSKTTKLALRPSKKLKRGADDDDTLKKPAAAHSPSKSSVSDMNVVPKSATADPFKEEPGNRGKLTVRHTLAWWDVTIKHISHYQYEVPPSPDNKAFEAPPESYGHKVTFTTLPAVGHCPLACHGYVVKWDVEEMHPPSPPPFEKPPLDLPKIGGSRGSGLCTYPKFLMYNDKGKRIWSKYWIFKPTKGPKPIKMPQMVFGFQKLLQVRYFVEGKGPYLDLPCDPRQPFIAEVIYEQQELSERRKTRDSRYTQSSLKDSMDVDHVQ